MIRLPKILNQKKLPACIVFAIAGLANYYLREKGIDDEIDAVKYFALASRNSLGTNERMAFTYGKEKGIPSVKGGLYKVKDFGLVHPSIGSVQEELKEHGGLILSYAIHAGNFSDRLQNNVLTAPMDAHGMVIVGDDPENHRFKIANSWGETFADKGYFWLPYPLLNKFDTKGIFYFTL